MITRASCFHATRNFRARSRVLCANQPLVDFGGGFIRRTKKNVFYARGTLNITYPRSAQDAQHLLNILSQSGNYVAYFTTFS